MIRLSLAAALLCAACTQESSEYARVYRVTERSQLIGGPAAAGGIGDYLIENDKIRIIIHGRVGDTGSTTTFGATILDADLQRPETRFSGAEGLDALFELAPIVSLAVVRPGSDDAFTVVRAEASEEGGALLRIEGPMGNLVEAIRMFGAVVPELAVQDMWLRLDYELRPGENFLRVQLDAFPDGEPAGEVEVIEQSPIVGSESFMSLLKGDIVNGDPTLCDEDNPCAEGLNCETVLGDRVCRAPDAEVGGAIGGWLALMGKKTKAFTEGNGFDPLLSLKAARAYGRDFFDTPAPFSFLAGAGDRISYALHTDGDLLVPISTSAFTLGLSHEVHCRLNDKNCLSGKGVRMSGYFAVGQGDVASAIEGFIDLRGLPNARLEGVVLDQRTGELVSKADVVVFADPWPEASDDEVANRSYKELVAAHRATTTDVVNASGLAGALTHLRSDVGANNDDSGVFGGRVALAADAPQRVFLVGRHHEQIGAPVPVRLTPGETTQAVVVVGQQGRVAVEVRDGNGWMVPAKVTVGRCMPECAVDADCGAGRTCLQLDRRCVPINGCSADSDCDPDERCDSQTQACVCDSAALPRELGGHWEVEGVVHRQYIAPEGGHLELPPGTYELIASRGLEYNIDRQYLRVRAGEQTTVQAHVERVIDSTGFISADFHVHGSNSPDSKVGPVDRVLSFAGEGVELLSATDHDVLTDYEPQMRALGLQNWLSTQPGVESSPLMLSHFLGFPMNVDLTQDQNMPRDTAWDWYAKLPEEIIGKIRRNGNLGGEADAVVLLAHVYDYFNYFSLNSYNLNPDGSLIFAAADPILAAQNFSGRFDGFEIANGKSQDYIRAPTVAEMRDYNIARAELSRRLHAGEFGFEGFSKRHLQLGRSILARMLTRTPREQDAFIDARRGEDCGCFPEAGCQADKPDDAPCDAPRGVVEDWFRMANAGVFRTAVSNSDTHDLFEIEAGMPRNYVASDTDLPVQLDHQAVDMAVRAGRVVASYGPFIRFAVDGQGVGSQVISDSGRVRISVDVQSPTWFDVDRVEVFRNGRLIRVVEACAAEQSSDCIVTPNETVQNLNLVFEDEPGQDAWYVVAAMGVGGRDLAPVYVSETLDRLGFNEAVNSLGSILPIDIGGGPTQEASVHPILPWAMTNPIRVIVDGDGEFTAPNPIAPAWAER